MSGATGKYLNLGVRFWILFSFPLSPFHSFMCPVFHLYLESSLALELSVDPKNGQVLTALAQHDLIENSQHGLDVFSLLS